MENFKMNGPEGNNFVGDTVDYNFASKTGKFKVTDIPADFGGIDTPVNYSVSADEIVEDGNNLPVRENMWTRIKSFLFQEIKVELTPKQQEFENRMNEVLHQEVTFKKVHDFLFQEIKFGK